jgi:hypothetical protein
MSNLMASKVTMRWLCYAAFVITSDYARLKWPTDAIPYQDVFQWCPIVTIAQTFATASPGYQVSRQAEKPEPLRQYASMPHRLVSIFSVPHTRSPAIFSCRFRKIRGSTTANLFLVNFECIAILHLELVRRVSANLKPSASALSSALPKNTHSLGCVSGLHACTLEQEAHAIQRLALTVAKGRHQLLELCRLLDLEEDFVVVVRHLNVQVLCSWRQGLIRQARARATWTVLRVL